MRSTSASTPIGLSGVSGERDPGVGSDTASVDAQLAVTANDQSHEILRCEGIVKEFRTRSGGTIRALDEIDLTIQQGQFVSIVGPSGCGKTTLLRILADLEPSSAGAATWTVPGWSPSDRGDFRTVVFQEQAIFPWMSVLDNAAFGLRARGAPKSERNEIAHSVLERLGLGGFEQEYPHVLSGGMRQRVNLARSFVCNPAVFLMDEPLASLDEQTKILIQEDIMTLWEGSGKTAIYVTHSLEEAVALSDRVIVMSQRPGHIKRDISVPLSRPRDVAECRSEVAFVETRAQIWDALRDEVSVQ